MNELIIIIVMVIAIALLIFQIYLVITDKIEMLPEKEINTLNHQSEKLRRFNENK